MIGHRTYSAPVHGFERVEHNRLFLAAHRQRTERPVTPTGNAPMRSINTADARTRQPVARHASCIRAAVFMESPFSAVVKTLIRQLVS